ncbi:uncharacterized protein LOC113213490 [Frankliniella occidentalis]|uniref:Uncharacterized protein LOC113213490 n=1 Tax=Frankliniella occidentalis TaxID=133901 RepID=A0A6J1T9L4_FRAOC|nr:uncharacterized protein LOC113213490 [Frankliniella occidentalis]XP_052121500.1 uncharacterized protein LOC113213490 [Frankliniella occidentalis]
MEPLHDDVLLMVLEYVDVKDLLACRLVCKRLAELALHPQPWRHRLLRVHSILVGDAEARLTCPALRLAPCARRLVLQLPSKKCQLPYTSTRCAVSHLMLELNNITVCKQAAFVIRNQLALGRLRELNIWYPPGRLIMIEENASTESPQIKFGLSLLIHTLAEASGLKKLAVGSFPDRMFDVHSTVPITSSLKHFRCELRPKWQPFVDFVLAGHSATLEVVNLNGCWENSVSKSTSTARLLAAMANLRELSCPAVLDGIELVAKCSSLRKVTLHIRSNKPSDLVAGARKFLRRATQLREVSLEYHPGATSRDDPAVGLIRDLAWSGRSRVESLAIENGWRSRKERKDTDDNFPQEQSLLRALPALPALEHLHLQSQAPPQLLLALGPDTTPALRTLELGVYAMGFDVQHHCLHSWLHDNIIADDLLKVHPSIKLIPPPFEYYCSVPKDCTWCKSGCHQELSGNDRPLFRDALLKVCS